ncbi:amino acid permease, partial [Amycolatopsis regifaucium]
PMLVKRLRGQWPPPKTEGTRYFSLGKLGLPVNLLGVLWGGAIVVNLAWPRREVYNATEPYHWYLEWGAVLFVGAVAVVGFAYYWFVLRHKSGVLADHAAAAHPEEAAQ